MAKLNSVLIPKASGSIGNITFRSSGRNTVASEKIVTNTSRTAAQVAQRISFKDRMQVAVKIKECAPFLYKKKGFRSAYAELASRVMLLAENDWQEITRNGFLNILEMSDRLDKPIVQGDVSATSVIVDFKDHNITITAPLANFKPRKSEEEYDCTSCAIVESSHAVTDGNVTIIDTTTTEVSVNLEGHLLSVVITPSTWSWVWDSVNKKVPIPSVNVNGKRIGYSEAEFETVME